MNRSARRQQPKINPPGTGLVTTPAAPATPATLLELAVAKGAPLDQLERLMALKERWDENEARKAFVEAMAEFKREDLSIGKNKHVSYRNKAGTLTEYDHAELCDVTDVVVPALAKHGISHGWKVTQENGGRITVTCKLTHRLGHFEEVSMSAGADDSGGKNSIQAIASTKTYLERYTLLAATGLSTGGDMGGESDDDDGRGYSADARQGYGDGIEDAEFRPVDEQQEEVDPAIRRKAQHDDAFDRHERRLSLIRSALAIGETDKARTIWEEIPQIDQIALWLAPTKGGWLTTKERGQIKGVEA